MDLLFGLDMLVSCQNRLCCSWLESGEADLQKRHQCCIDLSTNTLRINTTEVPFLPEHELPDNIRRQGEAAVADEMGSAAGGGVHAGVASPKSQKKPFPGSGTALGGPSSAPAPAAASGQPNPAQSGRPAGPQFPESDIETVSDTPRRHPKYVIPADVCS